LLGEVLVLHGDALVRYALFHSQLDQDAGDALGDASVKFLTRFRGDTVEEARRWLLVVVKHCAWEISRRRWRRGAVVEEVSLDALGADVGAGLGEGDRDPTAAVDAVGDLVIALASLRPDESRALLLSAAGYSLSEIATIQGWTYTKVKRCVYEGRMRLRKNLEQGGEDR
jgi:DNA-directed RNA polymerase specialized sigma24 family protein